ncbi:MAG: hypothetical protein HY308_17705 [Gammaproteobacteria bacterium]|nr:hypothetical protein [Gammaproteobacteria bacterium]
MAELVGNVNKIATKLEDVISKSGLRHYFTGGEPTRPALIALANVAGLNIEWLAAGTGPMRPIPTESRHLVVDTFSRYCRSRGITAANGLVEFCLAYNDGVVTSAPGISKLALCELSAWVEEYQKPSSDAGEYPRIPTYDLDAVDDQSFTTEGRAIALRAATLSFRRNLLLEWKLDIEQLAIFIVRSDELFRSVRAGDWLLCDCRREHANRAGIFVLNDEGNYVIRRVQFLEHARVRLTQEDPDGEEIMEERKLKEVKLIGRVIIYTRRLRRSF